MERYYRLPINKVIIDFSTEDNFTLTMKMIEKQHWNYLDNYYTKNRHVFPKLNFYQFLEKLLKIEGLSSDSNTVKKYCRIYDKYKKSLPTAGALIIYRDNLLLIKVQGSRVYSLPKGKSDPGETLAETAIREVKEETGLDIKDIMEINLDFLNIQKTKLFIIQSDVLIKQFKGYNHHEICDIKWFNIISRKAIIKESS